MCHVPISFRYFLVELIMGSLWLAVAQKEGHWTIALSLGLSLTFFLVVAAFIDLEHRIIPNELNLLLAAVGLLFSLWNPLLGQTISSRCLQAGLGALVGGGALIVIGWVAQKIWKREAMGGGDIKFMAAIGSYVGWKGALTTLMFGSMVGTLVSIALIMLGRLKRKDYIPFGPYLALGAMNTWFFHPLWERWLAW